MATEYGNIDDMLMTGKTETQPAAPENSYEEPEVSYDAPEDDHMIESPASLDEPRSAEIEEPEEESEAHETEPLELDDYGNTKEKPRTYTEEEVNDRINKAVRERMSRFERNNPEQAQPQQQQMQQQVQQGFQYNPESEQSLPQQLESFIEQTFNKINQRQVTQKQQEREANAHAEFQDKFYQGMTKFNDFREVVGAQPITDPMTMALRALKDPASFIYAASKRHPQELQRISQIQDPTSQMFEMGKLEERMRKNTQPTKAPRPISRTREDAGLPQKDKKNSEPSIEDLIAKAEQKKMAKHMQRKGGGGR